MPAVLIDPACPTYGDLASLSHRVLLLLLLLVTVATEDYRNYYQHCNAAALRSKP